MLKYFGYIFCSFFCLVPAIAGESRYGIFQNIHMESEASVVNCFIQDKQGLIWVGTDKGLFSYDGYSVQPHFVYGQKSNSRIYCGISPKDELLYLGSDNGLLIYNYYTDKYEDPEIVFPSDIRAMVCRDGTLWIGTLDGLFTYDIDKQRLERVLCEDEQCLPHETVYALLHTSDDKIYVGTYDGLSCYYPDEDRFEPIPIPSTVRKSNLFVNSLLEDTIRNCIWIGTEGNLFKYIPPTGQISQIGFFRENSVKTMAIDQQDNLLVGTDNGLYVYQNDQDYRHITHDARNSSSLSNNIIWTIFTDRKKNIWLGTDYGISLSHYNKDFRYIPISEVTGTGEGNHFYSLYKDSRDNFWFGGTNGLIRFRSLSGEFVNPIWYKMGNKKAPLSHNRVRNIFEDRDRNIWIATDGSVLRYDYDIEQFVHYNIVDSTGMHNCNWAYYLYEDSEGYLWIASFLGGVFVVDKEKLIRSSDDTYVADFHYSEANNLPGMVINQLIPDHQGNIWILLYNRGITKINIQSREIYSVPIEGVVGSESLNYLLCDGQGVMWAGFRNGVMRFDPEKALPDATTLSDFGDREILSMTEVDDDIWLTTTDGTWVICKETMRVRRLHITDKIFTSLFYDKKERIVYLGGVDGFVVTSPDIANVERPKRPITLTALYINNDRVAPDGGVCDTSIRYAQQINLNHRQNNLSFEVSDFSYSSEEKPKFIYKLISMESDQEWNFLKVNTNRIIYHNLKFGNYQLLISEADFHGNPSDNPYVVDIKIAPPWYYTVWAKMLYVVLAIGFIVWIINFFLVRSRLKFERLDKERILEQSQSKVDFFTNVSHDFKTPLSMIIAPVSKLLLETKNPDMKKQLETVQRNAKKLNTLIHQVLDFNRVDDKAGSLLILSSVEIVSFTRNLFSVFRDEAAKEKNLECVFESDVARLPLAVDVVKFESIIGNALSNAFKYTPEGGRIALSIHMVDLARELIITISDTGSGIPEKDLPYVFQRFFQSSATVGKKEGTGVGLYLVKSYVELHGGKVEISSELGKGTTLKLTLPLSAQQVESVAMDDSQVVLQQENKPVVLVVDDNADLLNFICELLRPYYRCETAQNGREGLERCLGIMPDLIITDVMMPVMGGLEMCGQIKKHVPASTIPIIMLTAKNDKSTELESIHLLVDAFIPKPFEPEILLSRVDQLVQRSRQMEKKTRIEVIATPSPIEAESWDEKLLTKLTQIIEDHIADSDLNVSALCELLGINNKQLYRKLKQMTGMSPVEYIKSIRMKKAAMLLQQKKFTVAEVMYMVGFSNHSYFSKCFQVAFGKTPRQFMEEQS